MIEDRIFQQEKLDNLSLSGDELIDALKSLAWINRWFGNHQAMITTVDEILKKYPEKRHIHIVDLGCGGGDVMLQLAKHLKKRKISFTMLGIDGNPNSLAFAKKQNKNFPEISYEQANILSPEFVVPFCDILISSHFLYHFRSNEIRRFVENNLPNVHLAIVNSGLERNKWALWLFKNFSFLLPMSQLAKEDGQLAIKRAFTQRELIEEISHIPNMTFKVKRVPLFRLKMTIFPSV